MVKPLYETTSRLYQQLVYGPKLHNTPEKTYAILYSKCEGYFHNYTQYASTFTTSMAALRTALKNPDFHQFFQSSTEGILESAQKHKLMVSKIEDLMESILLRVCVVSELVDQHHSLIVSHDQAKRVLMEQTQLVFQTQAPMTPINEKLKVSPVKIPFNNLTQKVRVALKMFSAQIWANPIMESNKEILEISRELLNEGPGIVLSSQFEEHHYVQGRPVHIVLLSDLLLVSTEISPGVYTITDWDELRNVVVIPQSEDDDGSLKIGTKKGILRFSFMSSSENASWVKAFTQALAPFTKAPPLPPQPYNIFGISLANILSAQKSEYPLLNIPAFAKNLFQYTLKHSLGETGILRLAGNSRNSAELKLSISAGNYEISSNYSIHDYFSIFKQFLCELPEPLLTAKLYDKWMQFDKVPFEKRVSFLYDLIRELPRENFNLLSELIHLLYQISQSAHFNKMRPDNIAIVISRNLLWTVGAVTDVVTDLKYTSVVNDIVTEMINHYKELFPSYLPQRLNSVCPLPYDHVFFNKQVVGHKRGVRQMIVDESTKRLYTLDADGLCCVWEGSELNFLGATFLAKGCTSAAISQKKLWITTLSGLLAYNLPLSLSPSVEEPGSLQPSHSILVSNAFCLAFKDNQAILGCEGLIAIADTTTMAITKRISLPPGVYITAIAAVGEDIWAGSNDLFVVREAGLKTIPAHKKKINKIITVGDKVWACSDDNTISIWESSTATLKQTLNCHKIGVYSLLHVNGCVWSSGWDDALHIWRGDNFKLMGSICGLNFDSISCLGCFENTSKTSKHFTVISGSFDGGICSWDVIFPTKFGLLPKRSSSFELKQSIEVDLGMTGERRRMLLRNAPAPAQITLHRQESGVSAAVIRSIPSPSSKETKDASRKSLRTPKIPEHLFKKTLPHIVSDCCICKKQVTGVMNNCMTCSICGNHFHNFCLANSSSIKCQDSSVNVSWMQLL
eukprot:TRINITY_DN226_c1_g3_i1.p1 TRINITY_DN226_c1_g3~~TRINITY_DN226_c1_g3_i1.p1  ORF type:complete len:1005 (-),score=246.57 TRINITY_DN226_c1_g3_i1:3066-5957(-)